MERQKDHNGWEFYEELPTGYRPAVLDDFHVNGRKKIGMEFMIRWVSRPYYQVCVVSSNLTGEKLKPFIEDNRVFVKA